MAAPISPLRKWWIKLTNFEFWPFDIFYFPVKVYYAFLALRSRSFFFFTASNPTIEFGGLLGEKKSEVFDLIPEQYIPKTRLFQPESKVTEINEFMRKENISFPIILKPDVGERGWMVRKIKHEKDIDEYLERTQVPFLLQEYVDFPVELGVFFIKVPGEEGRVTSIVKKGFLSVIGNGKDTVKDLLLANPRAAIQLDFESEMFEGLMERIPEVGEEVEVEAIGNHCRGTTFLNGNSAIDDDLHQTFNQIADEIEGFYFGRFDLRCRSIADLKQGKNFKILELNGAGSEPGHIYQPGFPLWRAYKDVCWHLKMLRKVSARNRSLGHEYWSFSKGWAKMKSIQVYQQQMD